MCIATYISYIRNVRFSILFDNIRNYEQLFSVYKISIRDDELYRKYAIMLPTTRQF